MSLREYSWYHGPTSRQKTWELLNGQEQGVYLVRDSSTIVGDYVLSVSENAKVSHYIINNKSNHYKIGEQTFPDIPSIIEFYKEHFLDTTTLVRALEREMKVKALYNFDGNDTDDLPFRKGDVLVVVKKDEDEWWTARDTQGRQGLIPKPYVEVLSDIQEPVQQHHSMPTNHRQSTPIAPSRTNTDNYFGPHARQRASLPNIANPESLTRPEPPFKQPSRDQPLLARAVIDRVCSPYDQRQLSFKKGDLLKVTKQNDNGIWEGDLNEKSGEFPMSHVTLIDPETMEPYSNGY